MKDTCVYCGREITRGSCGWIAWGTGLAKDWSYYCAIWRDNKLQRFHSHKPREMVCEELIDILEDLAGLEV